MVCCYSPVGCTIVCTANQGLQGKRKLQLGSSDIDGRNQEGREVITAWEDRREWESGAWSLSLNPHSFAWLQYMDNPKWIQGKCWILSCCTRDSRIIEKAKCNVPNCLSYDHSPGPSGLLRVCTLDLGFFAAIMWSYLFCLHLSTSSLLVAQCGLWWDSGIVALGCNPMHTLPEIKPLWPYWTQPEDLLMSRHAYAQLHCQQAKVPFSLFLSDLRLGLLIQNASHEPYINLLGGKCKGLWRSAKSWG